MNQTKFIHCILIFFLLSVITISCQERGSKQIALKTPSSKIVFDQHTGEILSFIHIPSGQEFISPDAIMPLFSFILSKPYEGESAEVSAKDFRKIDFFRKEKGKMELAFTDHESMPLKVTIKVNPDSDGFIHMNLSVSNLTERAIKSITFPQITSPPQLGKEVNDDVLLIPSRTELLVEAPGTKNLKNRQRYPQTMDVQFASLYDSTAGMYIATYDNDSHYKDYKYTVEKNQSITISISHLLPEIKSEQVELPYDIVLGTFVGDWYNAADNYKRWAKNQNWCSKKISQRDDIPVFFREGSALFCVPFLHEKPEYKLYPFEDLPKLPEIAKKYQELTGMPHIGFAPFGWENRGAWAGINYFPAQPSNEIWQKVNSELKKEGNFTFFMPSGFKWVVKRKKTMSGPAFDDTADFERRKEMCIQHVDGTPILVDKYSNQDVHTGLTTKLCHSCEESSETMRDIFLGIARLGTSLIQFDQEHGGAQPDPCYNKNHEHPPGFSNQYCTDFYSLCKDIYTQGKAINPNFGLSIESTGEGTIQYGATMWGRQCSEVDSYVLGARSVGLFSYIYHEYIPVLGDGFSIGQGMSHTWGSAELRCYRLALTLVRGLIPTVYMEQVSLNPDSKWVERVAQAFISYCKPYPKYPENLLQGVTLHPPEIECEMQSLWHYQLDEDGDELPDGKRRGRKVTIDRPTVIGGSFEAEDGSIGTFIVNTTPEIQQAKVKLGSLNNPVTLYNAKRIEEQQWDKCPEEVNVSLKPYGVKVFILP